MKKLRIALVTTNRILFERYCFIHGLDDSSAKQIRILRDTENEVFSGKELIEDSANVCWAVIDKIKIVKDEN